MTEFIENKRKYNCRKNGKPYYRLSLTINGKRHEIYGDGEKDARRKAEELKQLAAAGYNIDSKSTRVGEAFRYWLFNIKRVDKDIKATTFSRYEVVLRRHVEAYPIAKLTLNKLDSVVLQAYVTGLYEDSGLSGANIKNIVKVWRMFLAWAADEGYIVRNPAKNLSLPGAREKGRKEVETFSEEERKRIYDYMAKSHYQYDTIVLLAFATGMRQGELLGLKWEDVHDDAILITRSTAVVTHVDKQGNRSRSREVWDPKTTNSVRSIPLTPATKELMRKHKIKQAEYFLKNGIPRTDYVFTTKTGKLIDQTSFTTSFSRLLDRAGVKHKKFHAIRHTFATEAIQRGVNVKDLQMIMGHADIETTYIYVHANDDTKRRAMELMGEMI